jgi:chromosome segregation ATPase
VTVGLEGELNLLKTEFGQEKIALLTRIEILEKEPVSTVAEEAQEKITSLEEQLKAKQIEVHELGHRTAEYRDQLTDLQSQLATADAKQSELEKVSNKITDYETEITQLKAQLAREPQPDVIPPPCPT